MCGIHARLVMVCHGWAMSRSGEDLRDGVLSRRKHVITEQGYIPQLVRCLEEEGVRPVPIFINGIEAHTVVCPLHLPSCPSAGLLRPSTAFSLTSKEFEPQFQCILSDWPNGSALKER